VSRITVFVIVAALLAGLALSLRNPPVATETGSRPEPPVVAKPERSPHGNPPGLVTATAPSRETQQALPVPDQTSWQNPFDPELWFAEGWSLTESGLKAPAGHQTPAVFARPYRQLMLELMVQAPGQAQAQEISLLDVQFVTDVSDETLSVEWTSEVVSVRRFLNDQPRRLRSSRFTADSGNAEPNAETAIRLRITLTANRLLIQCDNRPVLNLDRPAPPATRPARVALIPGTAGLHIIEMRLEGE